MKEYVSTIIYICVFCIILELILPENKLKKYIGVLVSLIIIVNLITPLKNILNAEPVESTISKAIQNIQSNITTDKYNFTNTGNKLIFSSVKENLEQEIYSSCKDKFSKDYKINRVKISLTDSYTLQNISIYVKGLQEVAMAGNIIDYISNQYGIEASCINIIKEE